MRYHKHLVFKQKEVGIIAVGGYLKKVLIGVVGHNRDCIYVWSMKSTIDPTKSQKCKHKLIVGEPVTHL